MPEELPHLILCAPGLISVDLAVRACRRCQGGMLAWQALVLGAQEPGRAWEPGVLASGLGVFRGADWRSMPSVSPLLLADNYNHTTNDPTTETQSAQRTHRDFLAERSDAVSGFAILDGYRQQRRAAAGPWLLPALGSRLRSWPPHVGRAVRGCGDVVRAD